jgi:hypothetical protein
MRSILRGAWTLHKRKPSAATKGFSAMRAPLLRRRGARRGPRVGDATFSSFRTGDLHTFVSIQRAGLFGARRRLDLSPL